MIHITVLDGRNLIEILKNPPHSPLCKMVNDETIAESDFRVNPGIGKYRIEINPISKGLQSPLVVILLEKQIFYKKITFPFTKRRIAIITPDEDSLVEDLILQEFHDPLVPLPIDKARFRAYPECGIQKINFSDLSTINFMDERSTKKWMKPIEDAITKYLTKLYGV